VAQDWTRIIAHADMDAFYAAVEQLDDPRLRGRPVIVGPKSRRGVVLTASYEARVARVGSAMPMIRALERCPEAIVVPPRFERYREVSQTVMNVFADFSPVVEAISLDEAFLDVTGMHEIYRGPEAFARELKVRVAEATGGLKASVGVAATKFAAKVASAYAKPDGLTVVPPDAVVAWLAPQPLAVLWGAGPKTRAKLESLGCRTVGDVASFDRAGLVARLGSIGGRLHDLALGHDERPVVGARAPTSLSSERTLENDVAAPAQLRFHLRGAAETLARRLRKLGLAASGVRVKLKRSDFCLLTRQARLAEPSDASAKLAEAAAALLPEFDDPGPFRLVGLAVFELSKRTDAAQLDLLAPGGERSRRLERTIEKLEAKFGPGTIHRAGDLIRPAVVRADTSLDFLETGEPNKPEAE
jgi:DNA polymerase IV